MFDALDDFVEVRVADTGVGIDPTFLPHVFDRFRQADSTTTRVYGGVGLGLSIARQLVEAHRAASRWRARARIAGSTFIVRLPIGDTTVGRVASRRTPTSPPEPTVAMPFASTASAFWSWTTSRTAATSWRRRSKTAARRVTLAGNARDALRHPGAIRRWTCCLPTSRCRRGRLRADSKVRASTAGRVATIPAAAVTAHARDDERRQALSAGFHLHLAKPFEIAQTDPHRPRARSGNSLDSLANHQSSITND